MDKREFMLSEEELNAIEDSSLDIEKEDTLEAAGAWFAIPAMVGAFMGIPTNVS